MSSQGVQACFLKFYCKYLLSLGFKQVKSHLMDIYIDLYHYYGKITFRSKKKKKENNVVL